MTTIRQWYQNLLTTTNLARDPSPSPACECGDHDQTPGREARIQAREARSLRILRKAQGHKQNNRYYGGVSRCRRGCQLSPRGFMPGIAFYLAQQFGAGPNRAPGGMKTSWNWHTGQANGTRPRRREYNQALTQINFYMKRCRTRYDFLINEWERDILMQHHLDS